MFLENHEATVVSGTTDSLDLPTASVVQSTPTTQLKNMDSLDIPDLNRNLLADFSEEARLFVCQPTDINIAAIAGDQLPGNEDVLVVQQQKLEVTNHEVMLLAAASDSIADFSSDSEDLYQPSGQESNSSIDSDESTEVGDIVRPSENNDETNTEVTVKKRKRKGQRNPKEWKRQKNSDMRVLGQSYVGFKKDTSGKYKQTIKKSAKTLGPRCVGHKLRSKKGGPRQAFQCQEIGDEERSLLFSEFWALPNWDSKKVFVRQNVLHTQPKYRKTQDNISRKKMSYRFYLRVSDGNNGKIKRQVCKQMFMQTLSIGEKQLRAWVVANRETSPQTTTPSVRACTSPSQGHTFSAKATDKPTRSKKDPPIKDASPAVKDLQEWLNSLAKVESHYCRSSTDKLYLEPVWDSVRDLYRKYSAQCDSQGKTKVSRTTLLKEMQKMNVSLYTPKKDQCNECTMHANGTLDNNSYEKHIKKKEEAVAEKEADKCLGKENRDEIRSYTVDLQAVLLSPRLNAAANYYKTKLKVHNQVYYNLATKDVSCYVWHEGSGGLESDIFATIATKFVSNEINQSQTIPKKIIIWSDGCGYQNRNAKISNALLDISMKYGVIIEQKYLEVGHTQMEVDSCHSAIETKLKRRKQVFLPADYIPIIQSARIDNPYRTHYLSYSDFYKFNADYYISIRPGTKKGDPCVNDVVAFQYTPERVINFKLAFGDEWEALPTRPRRAVDSNTLTKLYDGPCPIDKNKYEHLQELKMLIPEDYRDFYDKLPFKEEEKKKKRNNE